MPNTCLPTFHWTISDWIAAYQESSNTPQQLLANLLQEFTTKDNAWIYLASSEQLTAQLANLAKLVAEHGKENLPLYGVPFAVKDNIDIKGWPTTAACPAISYMAKETATVVAKLQAAGAIVLGKTNLDQFATGLVGTRSPYGAVVNSFNKDYVSGGSSSGSASVVARGLVAFSLGTDTAGSGRVPAGFNNIVGLKPTRGWLSTKGLLPACRLIDCISVFGLTVRDAELVATVAGGYDEADDYSRQNPCTAPVGITSKPKLAIPKQLEFFADKQTEAVYRQAINQLKELGAEITEIDFSAFAQLAKNLYEGAWVTERTVALKDVFECHADSINPVVKSIVEKGFNYSAMDAFREEYERARLARLINKALAGFTALVVPTSPTIRTLVEMAEQPIVYNSQFGTYTNFTNLADLSALAVPAGIREDGLPAGITFIAPAWHDYALADLGKWWQNSLTLKLGNSQKQIATQKLHQPTKSSVRVAVVGAHLSGMPLNYQLTTRDAVLVEETTTSADYALYALAGTVPPKPGIVKTAEQGASIVVELWDIPLARFGEFVEEVPMPLGIGSLTLIDGRIVKGFICEPSALANATNITQFGGWRAYIKSLQGDNSNV